MIILRWGMLGVIINPRGTGGSGKTELARRILSDYGWGKDGIVQPLRREGRERPIGYRLRHPLGGRPLIVLGHYERTSGGCDTIPLTDGGLDEIFRLADASATGGHDVLLEGAACSVEYSRSAVLARRHRLHVLHLSTSLEQSVRNLVARRRARKSTRRLIEQTVRAQHQAVEAACVHLQGVADVATVDFDSALQRARTLLGLRPPAESIRLPAAFRGRRTLEGCQA